MATILVVDNHHVQQRVYSYMLRKHGHSVLLAEHGQEALNHLSHHIVDLVITDIATPEMDGLRLLRYLREDEHYHKLPVVVLTASGQDQEQDYQSARRDGANAVLAKPVSSRQLIDTVLALLGGRVVGA
jgi:CheY-like chemotaxis protein